MKYSTGEETKKKVIDSAFQLLADKGYDAMSIDDIMKGTGKTKGSFYVHFKNKEDLLYEVIQNRLDRDFDHIVEETLKELSDETCNVQLILKRLMHLVHVGTGGVDRELWTAAYYQMVVLSRKNQIVREWMIKQYRAWVDFMSKIIIRGQELGQIRTDIDVLVMVNMLISLLEGYELRSMVDPEIDVYEQLKLTEMFCINQ
ncbi:TetR/AcrR family transcriptional regulator [Paenibacillus sp. NPDC056579]|uniref:TetR/AcrR family transcriptional regulator n=1 Tax=unclassified Paenibacillus TaxID=185978 RepID=UPI001EF98E00|nr:TetR/AcrR family transcriptional regulator [Paenibacillus sp. H1-7]ULL16538.1 TetR/AcrR family transcriptional regulator [Paenibacillus sp. H1-7]